MRRSALLLVLSISCSAPRAAAPVRQPAAPVQPVAASPPPAARVERITTDTARNTVENASFLAPAGWSLQVRGAATVLEAPEGDSHIALVDVRAKDPDAAVAAAWAAYGGAPRWPLESVVPRPDLDGWEQRRRYAYLVPPNLRRDVSANTMRHGEVWTVALLDCAQATEEKRLAQLALIFGRLMPRGYQRESFAGRRPNPLGGERLKELSAFIERGREQLGVPGVAIGILQDGKTVFAGGFGVRELGQKAKVDADTLFLIASNTKAMTTLMLGKLVDEGRLKWDTGVTSLLPSFKLGDADTTGRVQVRHLICACTGMPRQDMEWLFEFKDATPESVLTVLGTMQPTSKFGELFQYSNTLAAAGGFVGGHVLYPKLGLGAAYDEAMKTRVFAPLGMSATSFDFGRALRGNHAAPHALNVDDRPAAALMDVNYAILPVRPAGGAWSNVRDLLRYVAMELARGKLPDGRRYVSEAVLDDRRAPQVSIGRDATYGMGLQVDTTYGVPVVHHGGSMIGYKTDMLWLPEHGVGAVILTNSDDGVEMLEPFRRKVLELLFDGKPEADARLAVRARARHEQIQAERKLLTVPARPELAVRLAAAYRNPALGEIRVERSAAGTSFDFTEWRSPVASRKNPDGTISFLTLVPGMDGLEFVVSEKDGQRALLLRDAQHEYVFGEKRD